MIFASRNVNMSRTESRIKGSKTLTGLIPVPSLLTEDPTDVQTRPHVVQSLSLPDSLSWRSLSATQVRSKMNNEI